MQVGAMDARIPISSEIREHLEKVVVEHVLTPQKIIINGKWKTVIGLIFMSRGPRGPKDIYLAPGKPRAISANHIKLSEIIIPAYLIQDAEQPALKAIEMMYRAVKIFLTANYKKITPGLMDDTWKFVDVDHLLSLPYPAPLREQKYVGDLELPDGTIQMQVT
jgi:hypothetical protein